MKLEDHPDPKTRWYHRRIMAYTAAVAGLSFPLLLLAVESADLSPIAWPFYAFVGSIVGLYIGSSAWESIKINTSG